MDIKVIKREGGKIEYIYIFFNGQVSSRENNVQEIIKKKGSVTLVACLGKGLRNTGSEQCFPNFYTEKHGILFTFQILRRVTARCRVKTNSLLRLEEILKGPSIGCSSKKHLLPIDNILPFSKKTCQIINKPS